MQDVQVARETVRRLSRHLPAGSQVSLNVAGAKGRETLALPTNALAPLVAMLEKMAEGHAITILPLTAELTTTQDAEVLGVSRPHVVQLLEEGQIPHRKVGKHRRIRVRDLMEHQRSARKRSEALLGELAAESQKMGLYDPP